MHAFLDNNSSMEAHPVSHVNNPYVIRENTKKELNYV